MFQSYEKYLTTFGSRFTRREKNKFLHELDQQMALYELPSTHLTGKKWLRRCDSVVYGNLNHAKVVFNVPYDTPSKMLWFKNRYYPLNGEKTQKKGIVPMVLQVFLVYFVSLFLVFVTSAFADDANLALFATAALVMIVLFVSKVAFLGIKNRKNYNMNGSGLLVALRLLEIMSPDMRKQVAFAFTDSHVATYLGERTLAEELKKRNRNPLVVALNTCGVGSVVGLGYSDGVRRNVQAMVKHAPKDKEIHTVKMSEGQLYLSAGMYFEKVIVVSAGELDANQELLLTSVMSGKDRVLDEAMLEALAAMCHSFVAATLK